MQIIRKDLLLGISIMGASLSISTATYAQSSTVVQAESTTQLTQLINTGATQRSHNTYWDCNVQNAAQHTVQIHVRLWNDQSGFSGVEPVSWSADSSDSISISYERGTFQLQQIRFESDRYEHDGFTATDQGTDSVSCKRVGPLRTSPLNNATLLEDSSTSLLVEQLQSSAELAWVCELTDNQGVRESRQLQFKQGFVGTRDDMPATWFVDDQYNVLISYQDGVDVIRDIVVNRSGNAESPASANAGLTNTQDILTGKLMDKSISCLLM